MDKAMISKIDGVLDRVKEPESDLSITQLGLVKRISYSEKQKKLCVFTNSIKKPPLCCTIPAMLLLSTTTERLTAELKKEFPDLSIEFA